MLLSDGNISLTSSLALEKRLKACWDVKEKRLERACREFESDLSSLEEDLYELTEDWTTWESFSQISQSLRAVNGYLQSLDLPIDRFKFFEKRIKAAQKQLVNFWLGKVEKVYHHLEESFSQLQNHTDTEKYNALVKRYQQLKAIKEDLMEFVNILNNPPLYTLRQNRRLIDLNSREQQLWSDVFTETKNALSKFKSAKEMVSSALHSFFESMEDDQVPLRDKYEQMTDLRQLVKETGFRVPPNQWEQLNQANDILNKQIKEERKDFLEAVKTLTNDVSDTREPEDLLERIKQLQQVKKTLPLEGRTLAQVSNDLNGAWETLSNRIAERNRILSENLSKEIDKIQALIDSENIGQLYRILRGLSDRVRRSPLSHQWKTVEENRISQLFSRLRDRENRGRSEAVTLVQQVEKELQSDTDTGTVCDLVKRTQSRLKEIDIHYEVRQELADRLQKVWEACDAVGDAAVQEIEPQVRECERLVEVEQSQFDVVVFSKIYQVQQLISEKINTQGLARQLWPLRQRLNNAWQIAQKKQSESASLLESLLQERISACERMACEEDDFAEVFDAIKEAQAVLKQRQTGLRLSKSPAEYRTRLERAWDYTNERAKKCGDETNYWVRYRATEIQSLLETNVHISQIFNQLRELNDFKRARWKNKEDMDSLNQLVSSLWEAAKNKASQQRAEANETALQALERSMLLADCWFDWNHIREQLRETENLFRDLPLAPHYKRLYQEQIALQYDLVRERQQKERDEVFDYKWLLKKRWYCIERGMVDIKNQRWPKDKIEDELSEHDLFVLTHIYDIVPRYSTDKEGNAFVGVEYDENTLDYVIIRKFRLPRIWYQPFTQIRIDFPKSYPHTPPIGWYMDNNLKLQGWENAHHYFPNMAFHGAKAHQGWAWYCCNVKSVDEPGGWRPSTLSNPRRKDNLWSYIKVIQSALSSEV